MGVLGRGAHGLALASLVAALAGLAGCYEPSIADCQVTCTAALLCPSGFDCVAGLCRSAEGDCPGEGDGGLPAAPWAAVVTGGRHTCATTVAGALLCWGDGSEGQTGDPLFDPATPTELVLDDPRPVTSMCAGDRHTCVVQASGPEGGRLSCFGADDLGQIGDGGGGVPIGIPGDDWVAVTCGDAFTCGLRASGEAACWGDNGDGQVGVDDDATVIDAPRDLDGQWLAIAAGGNHACALGDGGAVSCWGDNSADATGDRPLGVGDVHPVRAPMPVTGADRLAFEALAAGRDHTCGVAADRLYCWGKNDQGQLGLGVDDATVTAPTEVVGEGGVRAVAAGGRTTCAIALDGGLACWGFDDEGQLGTPDALADEREPRQVSGGSFRAVAVGGAHACALDADGALACWGSTSHGLVGDGQVSSAASPVAVQAEASAPWEEIATGDGFTCAITTDGELFCFGDNRSGQLGADRSEVFVAQPVVVENATGDPWTGLSAGVNHACAQLAGGEPSCWGANFARQLGSPMADDAFVPRPVSFDGATAIAVRAGAFGTCGLGTAAAEPEPYCWGANEQGQVGTGELSAVVELPTRATAMIGGLTGAWQAPAMGVAHGCGIVDDTVVCVGADDLGQRGDGTDAAAATANQLPGSYTQLAAGAFHTCAIVSSSGVLECWGENSDGQLGDGTTDPRPAPTAVGGGAGEWSQVTAGRQHTCAVRTTSEGYCWGGNAHGQLGLSDRQGRREPDVLPGTWYRIAAGVEHTCGIAFDDRSLWCWGRGHLGQLGNGTSLRLEPYTVMP